MQCRTRNITFTGQLSVMKCKGRKVVSGKQKRILIFFRELSTTDVYAKNDDYDDDNTNNNNIGHHS